MRKKEKKEKITWVDDGRTISDMSATRGSSHKSVGDGPRTSRNAPSHQPVGDGASTSRNGASHQSVGDGPRTSRNGASTSRNAPSHQPVGDGPRTSRKQPLARSSKPPRSSLREQWETYCAAVRMMFLPMLAVLGIIALAFLIVYILL